MNNDVGGVVLGFNAGDGDGNGNGVAQVLNLETVCKVVIKELEACYRVWLCCCASSHKKQARDFHERIEKFFELPNYSNSKNLLEELFA